MYPGEDQVWVEMRFQVDSGMWLPLAHGGKELPGGQEWLMSLLEQRGYSLGPQEDLVENLALAAAEWFWFTSDMLYR